MSFDKGQVRAFVKAVRREGVMGRLAFEFEHAEEHAAS